MTSELEHSTSLANVDTLNDSAPNADNADNNGKTETPMMKQYLAVKAQHPHDVVLFRLGDFFEMFFDDAIEVSAALGLALTRRGKNDDGQDIPMCGIPASALENYLPRLVHHGFRLVVCEQVQPVQGQPAETEGSVRKKPTLFERKVVRVITPATLTEDHLITDTAPNHLVCLHVEEEQQVIVVGCVDITLGTFTLRTLPYEDLDDELSRLQAKEILVNDRVFDISALFEVFGRWKSVLYKLPLHRFDRRQAQKVLLEAFKVPSLSILGDFSEAEFCVAGVLVDYVRSTHPNNADNLKMIRKSDASRFLTVDANTIRHLELVQSFDGQRSTSVLGTIFSPVSPAGQRCARQYLLHPCKDLNIIRNRQDAIAFFLHHSNMIGNIRDSLRQIGDLERAIGRLVMDRWTVRDLLTIREGLATATNLRRVFTTMVNTMQATSHGQTPSTATPLTHPESNDRSHPEHNARAQDTRDARDAENAWDTDTVGSNTATEFSEALQHQTKPIDPSDDQHASMPTLIRRAFQYLGALHQDARLLQQALNDTPANSPAEGDVIRHGYQSALDELRGADRHLKQQLERLVEEYRRQTGIKTLNVKRNDALGFFIEVPSRYASKLTMPEFRPRQSLLNAARFDTIVIGEIGNKIQAARNIAIAHEISLVRELVTHMIGKRDAIHALAQALGFIDWATDQARQARDFNYTRPLVDNSHAFQIVEGRHPVVEIWISGARQAVTREGGRRSMKSVREPSNPQNSSERVVPSLEDSGQSSQRLQPSAKKFHPNGCDLAPHQHIWLITGPNMGGKSTFLRQTALIALLAHVGCYVPASSAHIGLIDRIFTRVGANDNLTSGLSTFMVEMVEMATILRQSTKRSLAVVDEIGRGTSTYDGLALAWACLEYIHDILGTRTLFATHYHELNRLAERLPKVRCYHASSRRVNNHLLFLYAIESGAADRSFGLDVAQMAGLPTTIVTRARHLQKMFDSNAGQERQTPLWQATAQQDLYDEVCSALRLLHPDLTDPDVLRTQIKALQERLVASPSGSSSPPSLDAANASESSSQSSSSVQPDSASPLSSSPTSSSPTSSSPTSSFRGRTSEQSLTPSIPSEGKTRSKPPQRLL